MKFYPHYFLGLLCVPQKNDIFEYWLNRILYLILRFIYLLSLHMHTHTHTIAHIYTINYHVIYQYVLYICKQLHIYLHLKIESWMPFTEKSMLRERFLIVPFSAILNTIPDERVVPFFSSDTFIFKWLSSCISSTSPVIVFIFSMFRSVSLLYRPSLRCLRDENTHHRNSIKKKQQQEIAYCASIDYYNISIDTVPQGIPPWSSSNTIVIK